MSPSPSRSGIVAARIARVLVALILLQTLWFKFAGAEESVFIFSRVGLEPLGRFTSGIAELVAAILLLLPRPRFAALGAALALLVITGALFFHLTSLGIVVLDDGGLLFTLALIVFFGSALVLVVHRRALRTPFDRFAPARVPS